MRVQIRACRLSGNDMLVGRIYSMEIICILLIVRGNASVNYKVSKTLARGSLAKIFFIPLFSCLPREISVCQNCHIMNMN